MMYSYGLLHLTTQLEEVISQQLAGIPKAGTDGRNGMQHSVIMSPVQSLVCHPIMLIKKIKSRGQS